MVGGAFALGVVGYLAFGNKASPPREVQLASASFPVEPSQAAQVPEKAQAEPPVAPSLASKPKKEPARLELATPPLAAAELRRKCLEVDAEGKGKAKAVTTVCRPALDAEPKAVDIMVILARAEIDRGHLGEARSLARKALATDPQRFDAYVFLGTAEQEAGRIDEARAAYKKYLELAPEGPFARELRAILNNL